LRLVAIVPVPFKLRCCDMVEKVRS
jgi:hypothetical protein